MLKPWVGVASFRAASTLSSLRSTMLLFGSIALSLTMTLYLLLFPPRLSPLPRFWVVMYRERDWEIIINIRFWVVMFMGLISWIYWIWFGEEHEAWSSCPREEEEQQCSSEKVFSFFVFDFEFFQFNFLKIIFIFFIN